MTKTVLLIGGTGMLGSRIAAHLLNVHDAELRLLVRGGGNHAKRDALERLTACGATVIDGDLGDASSLDRATDGVDVIVSAVQGGPDVIVDGQVALAEAGKRNGVRRILPSDFGLDLFKAGRGEHPAFNWRQEADERIAAVGLEQINVLQGAFMEMLAPGSPLIDYDRGVVTFWGDGARPIELTTVEDTARMTARVAVDDGAAHGKLAFFGDRLSFQQVADQAAASTGRPFERKSLGTEADLRAAIAAERDPMKGIMLAYQLYMLNGQTSLDDPQNERYVDIKLQDFSWFLAERVNGGASPASDRDR